jgi:putative Holliday junction resolvase
MRVLALDLGERRIGVALSDSSGTVASPYAVIERSGDRAADRAAVAALLEETAAGCLVVGLPLSLSGDEGAAARAARAEAAALAELVSVPVETVDERLSTVEAARRRRARSDAAGRSSGSRRPARARRRIGREGIDAEAAAILLESWLASHRTTP